MTRKIVVLLFSALCLLSSSFLIAQDNDAQDNDARDDNDARNKLVAARAQYYTPTASGLKSFHCDATIDWKTYFSRLTGKEIPDDNPLLKYLQTVHLSIDDELGGHGTLAWTSTSAPPAGMEEAQKRTEEGLQAAVGTFFQSWNGYLNGSRFAPPDSTVVVTQSGEGINVRGTLKDGKLELDYDKNTRLTQALVESPAIRVLSIPTFASTPDGLILSSITLRVNRPPSAPQTETIYRGEYTKVDSFQIPSRIVFELKNMGGIDFGLTNCKVSVADWAKKQ